MPTENTRLDIAIPSVRLYENLGLRNYTAIGYNIPVRKYPFTSCSELVIRVRNSLRQNVNLVLRLSRILDSVKDQTECPISGEIADIPL